MTFVSRTKRSAIIGAAALAALGMFAGHASAQTDPMIAGWDFYSSDPSTTATAPFGADGYVDPSVTSATLSRVGVAYSSASYSFDSNGWVPGNTSDYDEFNVAVDQAWTVTALQFSVFGSNTGPKTIDVYTSVDNGAWSSELETFNSVYASSGSGANYIDIPLDVSLDAGDSLQVYLVADAATTSNNGGVVGSSGSLRINNISDTETQADDVQFNGTEVSAVPSPATIPAILVGMGLFGVTAAARRRRIA